MAPQNEDGAAENRSAENENENTEDRTQGEPRRESSGTLRVEDRSQGAVRGLAAAFRSRGWPGETAVLDYPEYRATVEFRSLTVSGSVDTVNQVDRVAGPLGADQRFLYPVLPQVPVAADVTSVHVLTHSTRELAATGDVIRDVDSTATKPETGTTVNEATVSMKQVASVESGVPNIMLAQSSFRSVIEQDLRLSLDEAIDALVLDAIATAGYQDPASDNILVSIRKAITVVQAAGYAPDTLALTPAAAEQIDTLVSGVTGADADFIFAPGQFAPDRIFGLQRRISKSIPAAAVLDSQAFGKLYVSPISLATFEENNGRSNSSTVRLEGHAAMAVERVGAAVRIAAS